MPLLKSYVINLGSLKGLGQSRAEYFVWRPKKYN
jgi:hypothetical protein